MSAWVRQPPGPSAVGYLNVVEKTGIAVAVLCGANDRYGSLPAVDNFHPERLFLAVAHS